MQSEDERKWEELKNAIILAIHKTMLESEFKNKYFNNVKHFLSTFRQHDADEFLKTYLENDFEDDNEGQSGIASIE